MCLVVLFILPKGIEPGELQSPANSPFPSPSPARKSSNSGRPRPSKAKPSTSPASSCSGAPPTPSRLSSFARSRQVLLPPGPSAMVVLAQSSASHASNQGAPPPVQEANISAVVRPLIPNAAGPSSNPHTCGLIHLFPSVLFQISWAEMLH
jgi:hypothetical protein